MILEDDAVQGQEMDFNDPCGSLLTQDILLFHDSQVNNSGF